MSRHEHIPAAVLPAHAGRGAARVAVVAVVLVAGFMAAIPDSGALPYPGVPTLSVGRSISEVWGEGWAPGSTVTITIDRPSTPTNPDFTDGPFSIGPSTTFDRYNSFGARPGDIATVTDGVTTWTHVVSSVRMTGVDAIADTISGLASPGATVQAWVVYCSGSDKQTTADGSGRWVFDYHGTCDLTDSSEVGIRELDAHGNGTQILVPIAGGSDTDGDGAPDAFDNCPTVPSVWHYDGDGDGVGAICDDVDRVWGANRYRTSAAVAQMAFGESDTVLIALGTKFPDALVAAAAGGFEDAPVLLTAKDSLPAETLVELQALSPSTAYIVGGTAVISSAVEQAIAGQVLHVKRLWGANRYETAKAVSREIFPAATSVVIASGENFPDALVGAAAAGHVGSPVLLTRRDRLPQATIDELNRLSPGLIYVIGGTAAISDAVVTELSNHGTVVRLAGANRYETAVAVANRFFPDAERVFLASGQGFPDALVAAAAGGFLDAPVLLVTRDAIPQATRDWLGTTLPYHDWLVGGTAVISDAVFDSLP